MGSVLATFDDLFLLRIWTTDEVQDLVETFRWKRTIMAIDRQAFQHAMQSRSVEAIKVFDDLDTDFDGKVDTFEVLLTLVLWSCTPWDDKLQLLFRCFDFNRKGALRFQELTFLIATTVRATKKFVRLDLGIEDVSAQKHAAAEAFDEKRTGSVEFDGFRAWFENSELANKLREFVDVHVTAGAAPEAKEAPLRKELRMQDYYAQELSQELDRLTVSLAQLDREDFDRGEQHRSLYEVLRNRVGQLLEKLSCASDTLKGELTELSASMNEETRGAGPVALVEPSSTLRHDQLRAEIAVLQRSCQEDCRETARLLEKMKELTYGSEKALATATATVMRPASAADESAMPPLVGASTTVSVRMDDDDRRRRILDRELKRKRAITRIGLTADESLAMSVHSPTVSEQPALSAQPASRSPKAADAGGSDHATPVRVRSQNTVADASAPVAQDQDSGAPIPAEAAEAMPIVVAFADFDPPQSDETQMLTLRVGAHARSMAVVLPPVFSPRGQPPPISAAYSTKAAATSRTANTSAHKLRPPVLLPSSKSLNMAAQPTAAAQLRDYHGMAYRENNPHETQFHMQARIGFRRPKQNSVRLCPMHQANAKTNALERHHRRKQAAKAAKEAAAHAAAAAEAAKALERQAEADAAKGRERQYSDAVDSPELVCTRPTTAFDPTESLYGKMTLQTVSAVICEALEIQADPKREAQEAESVLLGIATSNDHLLQ